MNRNLVAYQGMDFPTEAEIEEPIVHCQWIHAQTNSLQNSNKR